MPASSIIQGDQPAVLTVDANGTVQRRAIGLGISSANLQEVTSGLQPGEDVIVGGLTTLQPGEHVHAQPGSPDLMEYHAATQKGGQ